MAQARTAFCWSKVKESGPNDCWPWMKSLNIWGYGDCSLNGKASNASRAAYFHYYGSISDGMVICHKCDNPACCNPHHLFEATQAENLKDCRDKGRAVYRRGASHHRATAKLTEAMVRQARARYLSGETQTSIAKDLGVHSSVISRAVRGENWSHVSEA